MTSYVKLIDLLHLIYYSFIKYIANLSFTNTISGSYPIGSGNVANSLGVTVGKSKSYAATYSISAPKGKRKMIIFRPRYKTYQVVQRYYAKGTFTGKTATATVKVFDN